MISKCFAQISLAQLSSLIKGQVNRIHVWSRSVFISSPWRSSKKDKTGSLDQDFLAEIERKIARNKQILRKHSLSHFKARELSSSIDNLRISMNSAQQKHREALDAQANSIANIPAHVSIEILGNGTCHIRPCVALRTPLKTYLFNCPEGASRFLPQLRMKALNVNDIFITRSTWDNIAGISSILLSKETNCLPTRIHGAMNIKHFLECIRPFQDSDYGSAKYPSQVDERDYTMGSYEDAALRVTYLPLSAPLHDAKGMAESLNVAYLVELKEPPRRIDPLKLIAHKVPKGPLIGKLKNGETIELADGRKIQPEDVYSDERPKEERPRALVFECAGEAHIKAIIENSAIQLFTNGTKCIDHVVHLSDENVIQLPLYSKFVASLGEKCRHIVVNASCPVVPGVESIYRNHRLLNKISPDLFPPLHPLGWTGLVTQGNELAVNDGIYIKAAPLQRFWMRMGGAGEEPIIADLRDTDLPFTDKAKQLMEDLRQDTEKLRASLSKPCEYPKVSFLGTSSAVPSKYRNVSSYLLETSPSAAVLIDVGEGTYGQLRVLLGEEGCNELLCNLHAVFVTHAHQDHMNGLYTIIERRKEAMDASGKAYVPLVLVSNRNVLKPLKTYSMCFCDLQSLVEIVDISRHPITPPASPGPPTKRRRLPSPVLSACRNVIEQMPRPLFSEQIWNIQEIKAVQVHHTRMANGFVFGIGGKRVVFSGDTKPCDLLVEEGENADLLIHEATFEDGHEADALKKKHSTMGQAVEIGRKMKARHVILTHFSARYPKVPELPAYLEKSGNVGVAMDNLSVRFDQLSLVPKLIPIFREVYQEELFEIELRKESRNLKQKEERENKQKAELKSRENTVANLC
ncbi:metallo-beta-lactamase domain protein [Ancylostoma caninum]|uniref:ribonuclease Z n=1 Tax=Ancylostoma caninum TaxID=29170 RepID=A0A368H9N6_ANCCA|nr:metallo-beta-lactamase domain protein [Ancylostoma caninum]